MWVSVPAWPGWLRCGCRRLPGEAGELGQDLGAELEAVGSGVLLNAGHTLGAGDGVDVVALGEEAGDGDLRRCGADLGGDGLDFVG
jgi:hypothetical protein